MPGTRKLGRTSDSRNAMMRAMVTYLLGLIWVKVSPSCSHSILILVEPSSIKMRIALLHH